MIEGKQAYIVPGKVGEYDVKLSITLGIPILCGEPDLTTGNIIYSTKSGAKRIFQLCDIPIPMSAYDIQDKDEFEMALARLIINNLDVELWLFKIDDEYGARGHASLEVASLKTVIELRKRKVKMNEEIVNRLKTTLSKVLFKKVKLAMPSLYPEKEAGW